MELQDIDHMIEIEEKKKLEIDMKIKAFREIRKVMEKEVEEKPQD